MEDLAKVTLALVRRRFASVIDNTGAHSDRTAPILTSNLAALVQPFGGRPPLHLIAAKLHDVGEIGIPDRGLLKPGRL